MGAEVLQKGYKIVYEPEASVYHYHGIHQNGNVERCTNIVGILKNLHSDYSHKSIEVDKLDIVALIPMRGTIKYLNDLPLLSYTIKRALESQFIKKVIVSTDSDDIAKLAKELGAEVPFIRDASLSKDYVDVAKVLQYSLENNLYK